MPRRPASICVSRETSPPRSLTDAEFAEDRIQDVVDVDSSGNPAQRRDGCTQLLRRGLVGVRMAEATQGITAAPQMSAMADARQRRSITPVARSTHAPGELAQQVGYARPGQRRNDDGVAAADASGRLDTIQVALVEHRDRIIVPQAGGLLVERGPPFAVEDEKAKIRLGGPRPGSPHPFALDPSLRLAQAGR